MSQKLEDYEVLCVIGSGSCGTCYKVRNKFSNELFAWKAVDYGNLSEENKQLLVSEVNLLKSLNHPNIVKYCGKILHKETTTLYIITEWCEGGDLSCLIQNAKDKGKYLEEQFIWRILYQVSRAIQVCHSRMRNFTIFHRDIKPANVFLDGHGNAKLGDFGLARIVQPEKEFSETIVGTPFYMSPELIRGQKYNRKSDIWALGCLVYELCALTPPFNGANMMELADTIKSGIFKRIPSQYSDNMSKVISFMLSKKHEFRPTIEMILHHPSVVVNIKQDTRSSSRQSLPKNSYDHKEVNCSLSSEMVNLTLAEPELISNKVFKDKWAEKHGALKEKEAWLKKREESLEYKERILATREKHLLLLEKHARHKEFAAYLKKEVIPRDLNETGHESDMSVEPKDTPIRPTSAKLDPLRLPRPDILTNACKKLELLEKKVSTNTLSVQPEDKLVKFKEATKVRRSLTLDLKKYDIRINELDQLKPYSKYLKQETSHPTACEVKGNRYKSMVKPLRERQITEEELVQKLSTLKKDLPIKGKCDKENILHPKNVDSGIQKRLKNIPGAFHVII